MGKVGIYIFIYVQYILYCLVLILYLKCGGGWGGGGVFFLHFMLFPTFLETKILGIKKKYFRRSILFHLMFSLWFFSQHFFLENIEKCPFTYWLNGRWFPQIVDRDSRNLYPIYIYINCGVGFWTCWREISGDRVFLAPLLYFINLSNQTMCICFSLSLKYMQLIVFQFLCPAHDITFPGCPSVRHVLGVRLCVQRPPKTMHFQQIIMHA